MAASLRDEVTNCVQAFIMLLLRAHHKYRRSINNIHTHIYAYNEIDFYSNIGDKTMPPSEFNKFSTVFTRKFISVFETNELTADIYGQMIYEYSRILFDNLLALF